MKPRVILVPVDGASNIKLEALDYDSFTALHSDATESPNTECDGLAYNCTGEELDWFDEAIRALPKSCKNAGVVAPVARGCSGGLVDKDNTLMEVQGQRLTLAYTQRFPEDVEERFRERAGTRKAFFMETGSIREFPGSLTLLKRFVFEEMKRPDLAGEAAGFATYGALLSGHFLADDYLHAWRNAGNEHSYWMCHTGARNIGRKPGTPSHAAENIEAFRRLVPPTPSVTYKVLGNMPSKQTKALGLAAAPAVTPGGHDTCMSHIPILGTFYQAFPETSQSSVIHVEAGTWTMIAQIGGTVQLPEDGFERDVLVQGTVDGEPVVTARYGGGADFAHLKALAEKKGAGFDTRRNDTILNTVCKERACFILPNINPSNRGTGPFPNVQGRIIGDTMFYTDAAAASVLTNLLTALTTAQQVKAISSDTATPIVLTAGGAKDPYFGSLLATLTGRRVFALYDRNEKPVTETTTLGAAIAGKAACEGVHPYEVDLGPLGMQYSELTPLSGSTADAIREYGRQWTKHVQEA